MTTSYEMITRTEVQDLIDLSTVSSNHVGFSNPLLARKLVELAGVLNDLDAIIARDFEEQEALVVDLPPEAVVFLASRGIKVNAYHDGSEVEQGVFPCFCGMCNREEEPVEEEEVELTEAEQLVEKLGRSFNRGSIVFNRTLGTVGWVYHYNVSTDHLTTRYSVYQLKDGQLRETAWNESNCQVIARNPGVDPSKEEIAQILSAVGMISSLLL